MKTSFIESVLGDMHKFNIPEQIKKIIGCENSIILTDIGIPKQLVSAKFDYYETPVVSDNCLLLGTNTHIPEWILRLDLENNAVFFSGQGKRTPYIYAFYNSSLEQLLLSLYSDKFFIRRLILSQTLGAYYDNSDKGRNYEKYACLLEELITDIDERAAKEGAWHSLIEEMKLGVI